MAPRPVCHRLLHPAMAPSNGTLPHGTQQWHLTFFFPPMPCAPWQLRRSFSTQQWHLTMAPDHMPPSNGSQQRQCHPAMAAQQWHPAMAASNGTTSNPPTCTPTPPSPAMAAKAPSNGSPAMAPSNGTPHPIRQLVHPPPPYPQQWHPATAASNGTQQRHHMPTCTPTLSPAMAPSNGSPAMAPSNGTQQSPHPIRPPANPPTYTPTPAPIPSNGSTAMAPSIQSSNGTQQWAAQPATAPRPIAIAGDRGGWVYKLADWMWWLLGAVAGRHCWG